MAFTLNNKVNVAFKKLSNKAHSGYNTPLDGENIGSGVQVDSAYIFAEPIPANPSGSTVVTQFDLTPVAIDGSAYTALAGVSGDGFEGGAPARGTHGWALRINDSTPNSIYDGKFLSSNTASMFGVPGQLQIVPSKYAPLKYTPEVYFDNELTPVSPGDDTDYYIDTYSGILFLQDVRPNDKLPTKVRAYVYTGKMVKSELLNAVKQTGGAAPSANQVVTWDGTNWIAKTVADGTIGTPTSGDYTGGLFSDFISSTSIADAVQDFNNVLKSLAPKKAAALSVIATQTLSPVTPLSDKMYLSFDAANSVSYSGTTYTAVSLLDSSHPAVSFKEEFAKVQVAGATGYYTRLGVFSAPTGFTVTFNPQVLADAVTGGYNFPAMSYDITDSASSDDENKYQIHFNGSLLTSGYTLNLGTKVSGKTASGAAFPSFSSRTATLDLTPLAWVPGHNHIKLSWSKDGGGTFSTIAYIDWVYDPVAVAPTSYSPTLARVSNSAPGTTKWISGINYYTFNGSNPAYTQALTLTTPDFYKNTYSKDSGQIVPVSSITPPAGISITSTLNPFAFSGYSIGDPSSAAVDLSTTITATLQANKRVFGKPNYTCTVTNKFGKTGTSSALAGAEDFLADTFTSGAGEDALTGTVSSPTSVFEDFIGEDYRMKSSVTYNTQSDAGNSNKFDPTVSLVIATQELAVFNGGLYYPKQVPNLSSINKPSTPPNYSTTSGTRSYIRRFKNASGGDISTMTIIVQMDKGNLPVNTVNTAYPLPEGFLFIKIPGVMDWKDLLIDTPTGAKVGDITVSGLIYTIKIDTGSKVLGDQYFLVKVTAPDTWTGYIQRITVQRR